MKKKVLSVLLATTMTASLAACGSTETKTETNSETATETAAAEETVASDEGKVLNIYAWNEEFKNRVADHYPSYEVVDATHGKIGDVEVVWNITPSDDNAYQVNLDEALLNQENLSADERIDMFLIEADYALKYVDTPYTISVADLGITAEDVAGQYQYTKDVVTDSNGNLKGLSWQAAPGVLFYNREVAKEILGTDEPAEVQEYVKDWETFNKTAQTMVDNGYYMTSSTMDSYRVYSNNVTSKWVVDGKINIDANIMKWVEDSKALYDMGATKAHDMWGDDWKKGFFPEGKVFSYFGPAWLVNFCMAADQEGSVGNLGQWGAATGPQGFFWGGTWICGCSYTDNASLVKDIMLTLTTDEATLKDIVSKEDDFANNKEVMEAMAADTTYSSKILGGQNPLGMYCAGIATIDLGNISAYDAGCNEEFQKAMKNYFEGNANLDDALALFYKAAKEKYPELTY